jgi:hypothetical protein
MKDCIEEGILQSYVDGELSPETARSVAAHTASCQTCAAALDEARAETAMFATAFEAEMALDVPTVHLRERLDAAIAELNRPAKISERKQGWSLGAWLASFGELFRVSPQRAIGFASVIAVIAFAAIFAAIKLRPAGSVNNEPTFVAENGGKTGTTTGSRPSATPGTSPTPSNSENGGGQPSDKEKSNAPGKNNKPKKQVKPLLVPQPNELPKDELAVSKPLPGEQNYLKAIDQLTAEIQVSGETNMKPSLRAEYERNLAVVDQAIDSTRRLARRNPNDPDAVQFLYSSYQSKLDLLSTVAEQVRPTIATR